MNINPHNNPHALTREQWTELASVESIAQSFGICDEADPGEALSACAYGARFNFAPVMMPGYRGDLFLLVGDAIDEPLSIIRTKAGLEVLTD